MMREAIDHLRSELIAEREKEVEHLKSISGPTGMRNSMASVGGLERNSIRSEVIARLTSILEEEE
jgi:hypothetical protein